MPSARSNASSTSPRCATGVWPRMATGCSWLRPWPTCTWCAGNCWHCHARSGPGARRQAGTAALSASIQLENLPPSLQSERPTAQWGLIRPSLVHNVSTFCSQRSWVKIRWKTRVRLRQNSTDHRPVLHDLYGNGLWPWRCGDFRQAGGSFRCLLREVRNHGGKEPVLQFAAYPRALCCHRIYYYHPEC